MVDDAQTMPDALGLSDLVSVVDLVVSQLRAVQDSDWTRGVPL
jgi:hypothetical protein